MSTVPAPAKPYSVKEAAELLGLSEDHVARNHLDFGGIKTGQRYLIPRHRVDALVYGPNGPQPPLERVIALLPALSAAERVELARVALSGLA